MSHAAASPHPEDRVPDANPLPDPHGTKAVISEDAFLEVQQSEEFDRLRRTFRNFAFPMTAVFLVWYFAYVLLSVYAKDFMGIVVVGESFNVGHLLGLLQFVTTFLITWLYIRHANSKLDPIARTIRERLEGAAR